MTTLRLIALMLVGSCWIGVVTGPASADPFDRDAAYRQRVNELQKDIAADPGDADALVALAAFYLNPTVMREVEAADGQVRKCPAPLRSEQVVGGIKEIYAVPWVFRGDVDAAMPLLHRAVGIDPKHHNAHRQLALAYRMKEDVVTMQQHVLKALEINPHDLMMARLHMDFHVVQAALCNQEAARLRTPHTYEEERADGIYEVTVWPSEADKAQAAQLDAKAQEHRRESIKPMRNLMLVTKGKPEYKNTHDMANAMYYHWIGELGTAGGAAKAALAADPTDLVALDYLIDLTRGTHTPDLYQQYKAIRDRWAGADTKVERVSPPSRGPRM